MSEDEDRLQNVLDGYARFLTEKDLAIPRHQPFFVRWVREFLLFAQGHAGYAFEQTCLRSGRACLPRRSWRRQGRQALDLFRAEVGGRAEVKPWQIQQAADAVRIYRYQYPRPK